MRVQSLKDGSVEDQARCQVTLHKNAQQLKDQNQDWCFTLTNKFVDKNSEDIGIDNRSNAIDMLSQVYETGVGVKPDLCNGVVEKVGHDGERATRNNGYSALFGAGDLQDGT